MTTTTNLGLKKPEINDYVDVSVLNENMDKLDEAVPAAAGNALKESGTKGTPADNDGVVIVDSADSSKIKRVLWSKIKALFAPATHAAQHGVSGSDPVTPAAIGAYANGIKGNVNCNNLSDGAWTISASATNGPGAFACTLFHKDWNVDFASQIAFGSDHNVYYRVKTGGSWLAWQEMYSTLRYPSPSKIGAVANTGDIMTGSLTIQNSSYPDINLKNTGSGSATKIRNSAHRTQIMSQEDDRNYRVLTLYDKSVAPNPADFLKISQVEGGVEKAAYNILHTGNLSDLGIARIETGSYVGTGTNGSRLTFNDVPKLVFVWGSGHSPLVWTTGMSKCTLAGGDTYDLDISLSDKTLSWVYNTLVSGENRPYHSLNSEGETYGYAAFF